MESAPLRRSTALRLLQHLAQRRCRVAFYRWTGWAASAAAHEEAEARREEVRRANTEAQQRTVALLQRSAATVQPGSHRSDRKIQSARDLIVLEALRAQRDHFAVPLGEPVEASLDHREELTARELLLGITKRTGDLCRDRGLLLPSPTTRLRPSAMKAAVDDRLDQPATQLDGSLTPAPQGDDRVLNRVLRLLGAAQDALGHPTQHRQVGGHRRLDLGRLEAGRGRAHGACSRLGRRQRRPACVTGIGLGIQRAKAAEGGGAAGFGCSGSEAHRSSPCRPGRTKRTTGRIDSRRDCTRSTRLVAPLGREPAPPRFVGGSPLGGASAAVEARSDGEGRGRSGGRASANRGPRGPNRGGERARRPGHLKREDGRRRREGLLPLDSPYPFAELAAGRVGERVSVRRGSIAGGRGGLGVAREPFQIVGMDRSDAGRQEEDEQRERRAQRGRSTIPRSVEPTFIFQRTIHRR